MNTDTTARLDLPLLAPGQAQKELFHNEALALLDVAVQASVRDVGVGVPPADPAVGDCWVVGDAPTGAWAGHPGALAGWTAGGWRFVAPRAGMVVWNGAGGATVRYVAGRWTAETLTGEAVRIGGRQVVGAQRPAIAAPGGGTAVDAEARAVLVAVLDALRGHGLIAV